MSDSHPAAQPTVAQQVSVLPSVAQVAAQEPAIVQLAAQDLAVMQGAAPQPALVATVLPAVAQVVAPQPAILPAVAQGAVPQPPLLPAILPAVAQGPAAPLPAVIPAVSQVAAPPLAFLPAVAQGAALQPADQLLAQQAAVQPPTVNQQPVAVQQPAVQPVAQQPAGQLPGPPVTAQERMVAQGAAKQAKGRKRTSKRSVRCEWSKKLDAEMHGYVPGWQLCDRRGTRILFRRKVEDAIRDRFFANPKNTGVNLKGAVRNWFKNHGHGDPDDEDSDDEVPALTLDSKTVFPKVRALGASELWAKEPENKAKIVQATVGNDDVGAGGRQAQARRVLFEQQPPETKAVWEKLAKEGHSKEDVETSMARNQANLTARVGSLFRGMIGQGPHCVGEANFYVLTWYVDKDGVKHTEHVYIGDLLDNKSFPNWMESDSLDRFHQKWREYCNTRYDENVLAAARPSDKLVVPAEGTGAPGEQEQITDGDVLPTIDAQGDVHMVDADADEDGRTTDIEVPGDDAMDIDEPGEDQAVGEVDNEDVAVDIQVSNNTAAGKKGKKGKKAVGQASSKSKASSGASTVTRKVKSKATTASSEGRVTRAKAQAAIKSTKRKTRANTK